MIKKRFISMLVLLAAVATGARAQWTGETYTATATENLGAITVNADATLTINEGVTVTVNGGINVASGTLTVTGPGTLVVTGAKGNDGANDSYNGGTGGDGGVAISGNIIVEGGATVTATGGTGGNGGSGSYGTGGTGGTGGVAISGNIIVQGGATVTATGGNGGNGGYGNDYGGKGGTGGVAISGNIIVQGGATVTATGGNGGNGGNGFEKGGNGGNGGNAFAGTLTYKSGTVTANGGSGGSGGTGEAEGNGSSGSAGKAFANDNDVDFTQSTGYSVTDGTSTITTISNQRTVVISGGTPIPTGYSVSMKEGTDDATNWQGKVGEGDYQDLPLTGLEAGTAVSVKYNGTKKVKSVKAKKKAAPAVWDGDLSKLTAESTAEFATATDGMTIKGELAEGVNVKVSIAQGATVTLDGVTINGVHNKSYKWAGINCLGDATIILKDGTENTVKGFYREYPGIHVPVDKTLTIQGSGSLTASSNGDGCGIGGGCDNACGNIVIAGGTITANGGSGEAGIGGGYNSSCGTISITGGTVTATGGGYAAGIGGGSYGSCGNISITGGTVTATGGDFAAGIGSGAEASCGTITITDGVTSVTATKGNDAPYSIGASNDGSCGTVTIGGTVYWENNAAVGDGATYLAQATIVYPAAAGNTVDLSTLTGNYEAQNGDILTGATNYAITIAAGATVTLDGVNISSSDYCIKCLGDATIILKDDTENTLTSWSMDYPALWAGDTGTTLTIQGSTGVLNVTSGDYCAGIGGGYSNTNNTCGNIKIEGGVITAQGGNSGAGIGSDSSPATCGDIIITGGTVTATGGYSAAGIGSGSGSNALCGDITITDGVTSVTATKGNNANYSIGAGPGGSCGTVTIGGTKYWENNAAVGDGATYLATSPLEYQPSN